MMGLRFFNDADALVELETAGDRPNGFHAHHGDMYICSHDTQQV